MNNLADEVAFNKAVEVLRRGGVIAHATDTCYGFACNIFDEVAVNNVYSLKRMRRDKPVSILVDGLETAQKFGVFNKSSLELAKKFWPGALTIIVKRKKTLPHFLNPKSETVGIRVPGDELSRILAKKLGGPLITTSANISGLPPPYSVSAIKKQMRTACAKSKKLVPDCYLDSGLLSRKNKPSTVVDVSSGSRHVLRQGSLLT